MNTASSSVRNGRVTVVLKLVLNISHDTARDAFTVEHRDKGVPKVYLGVELLQRPTSIQRAACASILVKRKVVVDRG